MSKFMLMTGLCVGLFGGYCGVGHAGQPSSPAVPEVGLSTDNLALAQIGSSDHGQFATYSEAIPTRDSWRRKGFGANIVRLADLRGQEYYTVRVFER